MKQPSHDPETDDVVDDSEELDEMKIDEKPASLLDSEVDLGAAEVAKADVPDEELELVERPGKLEVEIEGKEVDSDVKVPSSTTELSRPPNKAREVTERSVDVSGSDKTSVVGSAEADEFEVAAAGNNEDEEVSDADVDKIELLSAEETVGCQFPLLYDKD